ncbi:hypothetical protein QBC37DRAFT_140890 [Rhypophila decipiens]|uniref:Nephrocystin 3-like N-terminal domain-containing protein n=1 Tax=Rhypophila decipiens TaxID=261697 RepID=A0AAN6XX98_9PEZI|nr:hypothetical protein QBC37DRAFT_140890 [Rhypophila decipiens]
MDPLTALSVASSVVALVDFGSKLVDRAFEIGQSSSGQPKDAVELHKTSQELSDVAAEARARVHGLEEKYPRHAQLMDRLNVECAEVEKQLSDALKTLTVTSSSRGIGRFSSHMKVSIRSLWSAKQLDEWSKKLDGIRSQVMMSVTMCLLGEVQETRKHVNATGDELQKVMDALVRIESRLDRMSHPKPTTKTTAKDDLAEAAWTWSELLDLQGGPVVRGNPPSSPLLEHDRNQDWNKKILDSLAFDDMTARREGIDDAFSDTFHWLFDPEEDSEMNSEASQSFTHWLESETDKFFWITGKPASRKSTLMKFISTHTSLARHLKQRAHEGDLLIAYFYFWGPGTGMQKSLPGLFRSLLHQLLSQRLDLCDSIALRRYPLLSVAGIDAQLPAWGLDELRECLLRFASQIQGTGHLALFLDGLDEFDGQHVDLISFLKRLQHDYGVKIYVSSRPWVVFSDAFKQNPTLRMEDLTKPDIDRYIVGRFKQSIAMQELQALDPKSVLGLMEAIADRSDGVFLWVAIVVEQILIRAMETPDMDDIWSVYNSLPADLEALYKKIHDSLSPAMQETSSKLYRMVLAWKLHIDDQIEAVHFWLAINCKDSAQAVQFPPHGNHGAILPLLTRLLASHSKGLLQIYSRKTRSALFSSSEVVDFIHRTAFDWLQLPEQAQGLEIRSPGFQPLLPIMAVSGAYLRAAREGKVVTSASNDGTRWLRFFHICSQINHISLTKDMSNAVLRQMRLIEPIPQDTLRIVPSLYKEYILPKGISDPLDTLSSIYCCRAYLRARFEASKELVKSKRHLLDAAVMGHAARASSWRQGDVQLRLQTVQLLLDFGAKSSTSLRREVRIKQGEFTRSDHEISFAIYHSYWDAVQAMLEESHGSPGAEGRFRLSSLQVGSRVGKYFKRSRGDPPAGDGRVQQSTEPLSFKPEQWGEYVSLDNPDVGHFEDHERPVRS